MSKTREEQIVSLAKSVYWQMATLLPVPIPWELLPSTKKNSLITAIALLVDGIQSIPPKQ